MPNLRYLSRRVHLCTLAIVLSLASNIRSAESAPAAQSTEAGAEQPTAEIRAVLQAQLEAWNRGDIDGFMKGYARSDSTVHVPPYAQWSRGSDAGSR